MRNFSDEHKTEIRTAIAQRGAVNRYLKSLEQIKSVRSNILSEERLQAKLAQAEEDMASASSVMDKLQAVQNRKDILAKIKQTQNASNITSEAEEAEAGFIQHAAGYAERKGISYKAWREVGVSAAALKQAGISAKR